ncbi:hypothetical protein V2W45_1239294, partial [Cenococcum geophilum]
FECDTCDRSFANQQALQQHLNSPAHAPLYAYGDCNRSFGSEQVLQQHSSMHGDTTQVCSELES